MYQWIDNSIISDSLWRLPTNKVVWADYLTDQKCFAIHMFYTKLEKKSYKMGSKALPIKIQLSKNWHGGTMCSHGADRVNKNLLGCVKLIGYIGFAVNVVSSNPCVRSSSWMRISFHLS